MVLKVSLHIFEWCSVFTWLYTVQSHRFLTTSKFGMYHQFHYPSVYFEHTMWLELCTCKQVTWDASLCQVWTQVKCALWYILHCIKPQTQSVNIRMTVSYSAEDCVVKLQVFSQQAAASRLLPSLHNTSPHHRPAPTQSETLHTAWWIKDHANEANESYFIMAKYGPMMHMTDLK